MTDTVLEARALTPAAVAALRAALGPDAVLLGADVPAALQVEPTGLYQGRAAAAVAPRDIAAVAELIAVARQHRLRLVPRGGGTGLVGGAIADSDEIVVDATRLTAPLRIDPVERTVTVGAGVTVARVQQEARRHQLWLPIEIGSEQSATIGGVIATNAGGTRVLRYGHLRDQLAGIEAVLGTGEVISRLQGWRKDNNGLDLAGLLCGSEGTLGIITAATLRLQPLPVAGTVAALAVRSVADAVAVALAAREQPAVQAIEFLSSAAVALLGDVPIAHRTPDGDPADVVLIDIAGPDSATTLEALLAHLNVQVLDTFVAVDAADRRALWALRHRLTESIRALGRPHKIDVVVPLRSMAEFLQQLRAAARTTFPTARVYAFGHIADGNIHVNVIPERDESTLADQRVFELARALDGHASAEHGIGRAKRHWLPLTRSATELAVIARLRAACDPDGVLNPKVLVPEPSPEPG